MMKHILELNLGAMILLTFAVGCGGSSSSDGGSGGATSSGGSGSAHAGAGGSSAIPGGGAHSGGQTSNPGTAGASPGGDFMTSVPGTTPLKDLTPDQKTQLCDDLEKYLDVALTAPVADFQCKVLALSAAAQTADDAAAQAACKSALTGCTPDPSSNSGMCTANTPATCTATVADLGVCLNDEIAELSALTAAVPSCDGMTLAQDQAALLALASSGSNQFMDPASCTKYDGECGGSMTGMP